MGSWDLRNGTPRVGCAWTDECLDVVIYSWTEQNPINLESSLTFESNASFKEINVLRSFFFLEGVKFLGLGVRVSLSKTQTVANK